MERNGSLPAYARHERLFSANANGAANKNPRASAAATASTSLLA